MVGLYFSLKVEEIFVCDIAFIDFFNNPVIDFYSCLNDVLCLLLRIH